MQKTPGVTLPRKKKALFALLCALLQLNLATAAFAQADSAPGGGVDSINEPSKQPVAEFGQAEIPTADTRLTLPASEQPNDRETANNRPVAQSTPLDGSVTVTRDYVLGSGDQLLIIDYVAKDGQYNTQRPTVMVDGEVSVYPVGVVDAAGKTVGELTAFVNKLASLYMYKPKFVVSLAHPRPLNVYVLGAVLNPGLYTLGGSGYPSSNFEATPPPQDPMLAGGGGGQGQAYNPMLAAVDNGGQLPAGVAGEGTILNALQRSGGLRDTADVQHIRVTKARTKQVVNVDLWKMMVEGDFTQDIALEPHDVVFVPRGGDLHYDPRQLGRVAANQIRSVKIWGQVKTPGLYQLGPGEDVLSIIARAGGFTTNAYRGSVLLSRVNHDGTVMKTRVPIGKALKTKDSVGRTLVEPGDIVIVQTNPAIAVGIPLSKGIMTAGALILGLLVTSRLNNGVATTGTTK